MTTIEIKVIENEIPYICDVDTEDIYMYIIENEPKMNCLSDEQKILKTIYEIWLKDKSFLECFSSDIPECSPYYGERCHRIENISLNDIKWNDKKTPSEILEVERMRTLCNSTLSKDLDIDIYRTGIDACGKFMVFTKYGTMHFLKETLKFDFGGFDTEDYMFMPKKKKLEIIEEIQMVIEKNINLIMDFVSAYHCVYY